MNDGGTSTAQPNPTTATPPSGATTPPSERSLEEEAAAQFAKTSGIPYFDTREMSDIQTLFDQIKLETLRTYKVAPLHRYSATSIELGLTEVTDRSKLPQLQAELPGVQLTFKSISQSGYNYILNQTYYLMFKAERDGDFERFGEKLATAAPKQAFQFIAQLAYWLGASDIHIEPGAETARIRFRLDGVLHPITTVAINSYRVFLSDLQTRAEIKWGSNLPQTGRISFNMMSHQAHIVTVNMRIETIPTFHGEEIVVRIFNDETRNLKLTDMGYSEEQIKRLKAVTAHPSGMVLAVGPTGSGKTSTLYALLNDLNTPEVKIVTLEDPVEYDLIGISQIPIHTDEAATFAQQLRAVMREDPNVVMIGEIRDVDTAKTALQASLTGHLVLSTFHATNASAAISRMLDLIGHNPLFASAIRLIIAQRLARRICEHCKESIKPTEEQTKFIENAIDAMPAERRPKLDARPTKDFGLKHGKGCAVCHGLGYKGRIGIVEMMMITPDIEKMMTGTTQTTTQDFETIAARNGMATLLEDGVLKALAGITTIDEIMVLFEA